MRPLFECFNLEEDKQKIRGLYAQTLLLLREEKKARRATVRARAAAWQELARQCKDRKMKLGQLADVLGIGQASLSCAIHHGDRPLLKEDVDRVFREWERIDEGMKKFRKTYGALMARAEDLI